MQALRKQLFQIMLYGAGLTSIAAVVYLAGPLIEIGGWRPLENYIIRDSIIAIVIALMAGMSGFTLWKGRKAKAALAEAVSADKEPQTDEPVLKDRMKDALATLKTASGGKGDFLYDLPWYVIIGPPGAGKTTALVNSGLKFPLSRGATPAAVAGVGGTRYCDWWFTENAVLIDTAGRYTTQDSDAKSDKVSWFSFLDLLKKSRPRQPINGVIIAISVGDILTAGPAELEAHADAIRARLVELHDKLKVDFPVYAVFTKTDLIAGFNEFFGILGERGRKQVWGATFQTADKTKNHVGDVPAEFDALISRLNELTTDRLQEEPAPTTRVALYGFPAQMAALRKPLFNFLNKIFEPTRYHANATLRGFYFTSGTQMGTPIDQLIGALTKSFGAEEVQNVGYSGQGKSYFLNELIGKLIIGEAAWVSTDWRALRRQRIIKSVVYATLFLSTAGMSVAWYTSFLRNRDLIERTNSAALEFITKAGPLAKEPIIADGDLTKVLPLMHELRYMPVGYATHSDPTPLAETFGLSRRERLLSVSENSYAIGLERLFRPRLLYRLEEQFEKKPNDTSFIYGALKVYLMLGGERAPEKSVIIDWMRRDWAEVYSGSGNAPFRKALEEHLVSMLELGTGKPLVGVNGALVESAQTTLARLNLAQRAYEALKDRARVSATAAFVPARAAGNDFALVFDIKGGDTLDSLAAPGFYTYVGFHKDFIDKLPGISEQLKSEQWVLGTAGQQAEVEGQYARLPADLMALYTKDFISTWEQMLGKLRLKRMTGDKPKYLNMAALVAVTSPMKKLVDAVRDETAVTRDRPDLAKAAEKDKDGKPVTPDKDKAAAAAVPSGLTGTPGAEIEAAFKAYHVLADGDATRRPIDGLIADIGQVHQTLLKATNPSQTQQANQELALQVAGLRSKAPLFPGPFTSMIQGLAVELDGDITGTLLVQINRELAEKVSGPCQAKIANRYPFAKSERDVALADFGQFFGPQGVLDNFVRTQVAQYIDTSKADWSWRQDTPLGRSIAQSTSTLREFQRAAKIRETFFNSGGQFPSMSLTVTPPSLPVPPPPPVSAPLATVTPAAPGAAGTAFNIGGAPAPPPAAAPNPRPPQSASTGVQYRFEVNGTPVASQLGPPQPVVVQWPGANGRSAVIVQGDVPGAQPAAIDRQGPWSLFRLIEAGSPTTRGDRITVSYFVGGRELSYVFAAGGARNPFTMPELREFRCPGGL